MSVGNTQIQSLAENLNSVIQGKPESVRMIIIALLAGGSVLMEDVPGVGKTTLAKGLARSIDASFNRIQFTPDLLPGDILGSSIYNPSDGSFRFRKGPVFCNILLADEINRASPRTQSALLEAMSEFQATIEGKRYELPAPFLVLATQNPIDYHGTYPLPEAQMDRFLLKMDIGYPAADIEKNVLFSQMNGHPLDRIQPVLTHEDITGMHDVVRRIHVDDGIAGYIIEIVNALRNDPRVKLGVSPRGSLMLFRAVQAAAFAGNRDYVQPDDVQELAVPVLAHRIILSAKTKYGGMSKEAVTAEILSRIKVPM